MSRLIGCIRALTRGKASLAGPTSGPRALRPLASRPSPTAFVFVFSALAHLTPKSFGNLSEWRPPPRAAAAWPRSALAGQPEATVFPNQPVDSRVRPSAGMRGGAIHMLTRREASFNYS